MFSVLSDGRRGDLESQHHSFVRKINSTLGHVRRYIKYLIRCQLGCWDPVLTTFKSEKSWKMTEEMIKCVM